MGHFDWSEEYDVFLGQIDGEHRKLFQVADGLEQAITGGAPTLDVKRQLQSLTACFEEHFSHEEWLMQSVNYSSYGWHKQQHETVRKRIKLFTPLIEGGETEAAQVFLEFLTGWLHDHTSLTDKMMAAHVRNYEREHATNAFARWRDNGPPRPGAATNSAGPFPKTIQLCKICGEQTTHEMRPRGMVCVKCAARGVSAELDRD
jgi:hemerythrin